MKTLDFDLIETILWENGEYFLLDLHLKRLEKSAHTLDFTFDNASIDEALKKEASTFTPDKKYRARLLFNLTGKIDISSKILEEIEGPPFKAAISKERTHNNDIFLYHKTTNRELYDTEYAKYSKRGFFDVLFLNQDDQLTEGCITNVLIENESGIFTPPQSCGLLPGVYREHMLSTDKLNLKEKVLYLDDLLKADKVYLINSVRKMIPVVIEV